MEDVRRIIIRGTNWVGDSVITQPAVTALRALAPEARIDIIAPIHIVPLWENEQAVDGVLPIPRPTPFREKTAIIRKLRDGKYDLGLLLPNSFESALWFYLGGVKRRVGFRTCGRGFMLTTAITPPPDDSHQVFRYLSLAGTLGAVAQKPVPSITLTAAREAWARDFLRGRDVREGVALMGINPGAAYGPAKCWPPERFAELIRTAHEKSGMRTLIVGAPGDRPLARKTDELSGHLAINAAGETDIMQCAALIAQCRVFVSNDTGPMHLAAAVGTPVVALFGPTIPGATGPRGIHTVIHKETPCAPCEFRECPRDHRCMRAITADEVYAETTRLMEGSRPVNPSLSAGAIPPDGDRR